jgi:hypothetical protein
MELVSGGPPYVWMCTTLLPCVVCKKAWGKQRLKEPLSDIVTCSEEREPKLLPESKYTNSGRSKKNGRSIQLSGWAQEGYITMYTLVAKDRLHCANFETKLMTTWRNCQPVAKVVHIDNKDKYKLFPANDLEGLAQPLTHCERKANRTNTYDDDNEEEYNSDHYDPNLK